MPPAVSVIIPTHNRWRSLRRCLDSLAAQADSPPFEVVVVDDGSSDRTAAVLNDYNAPYPLLTVATGGEGPAAARNLGADRANSDYLLFIDDDVVTAPGLLAAHLAAHKQERDAVIVGPMRTPSSHRLPSWVRWEQEILDKKYRALADGRWTMSYRQFYTANASLARRHFQASEGFDPTYRRAEDVELAYRLSRRGLRFVFRPEAVVTHYAGRSLRGWWAIPYQYGLYDVSMWREKGRRHSLEIVGREFSGRHSLVRSLVRLCDGGSTRSGALAAASVGVALLAAGLGAFRISRACYSLSFNLRYYQGIRHELGSTAAFRAILGGKTAQSPHAD